ncbi:hypothetical protein JQX13_14445 [Archangium violaceum]|uniref:hypothetical protein n=1 Tax=Archangium violaceum TaxID=83451 RepID=UPI00193BA37E|nr:hypothetical protein [Archangium violaceum]QRK11161.1 hypothetical protein JQX13_14445 [Archangium violaceum]
MHPRVCPLLPYGVRPWPRSSWYPGLTRVLLLLGLLAPVRQGAAADTASRPVLSQVKASSASAKVSLVLDANANTAWCPDARDIRGELTLSFSAPVKVRALELHPGRWSDTVQA